MTYFDNLEILTFVEIFLNSNNTIFNLNLMSNSSIVNITTNSELYSIYLQNILNNQLFIENSTYTSLTLNSLINSPTTFTYVIYFLNTFFKITLFLVIIYTIFFITTFEN